MRRAALLPGSAAALGLVVVGLSRLGAGDRPVLATLVLEAAIVAALLPLRFGLPVAIVLACFEGTLLDFVGAPATYWNEIFVALLVVRAILRRRPSRLEVGAASAIALVYAAYAATGTSILGVAWALEILILSVLAGWAIVRLPHGERDWHASYRALALALGAGVVVALWQRLEGTGGLVRLGIPYETRIRNAPDGQLRAFGGFTSEVPFGFALVLGVLWWVTFLLGDERQRRLALRTAWLPPAAAVGLALSLNRTAVIGLCAALLVGAAQALRPRASLALVGAAAAALAIVFAVAAPAARFLAGGFSPGSESANTRRTFWQEYAKDLSALGAGPGSAGEAYRRSGAAGDDTTDTPAERVYDRVSHRGTPLAGTSPGVVDNLYLSWLFQYGLLFGTVLCWAWAVLLLRPLLLPGRSSPLVAARLWGVFLVVAACAVSVWEEFPTDLLTAIVLGQGFAASAESGHA